MNKETLYIIDGSAVAYRSYYAMIRAGLRRSDGFPTGATYAFVNSILKLMEEQTPDYIAMVFDASEKSFRHEIYPEYKATREAMPEDLVKQLPYIQKITKALNMEVIVEPGYEADDVLGTLAQKGKEKGLEVYMVTGDKDLMQILDENVYMYKPGRGKKDDEIITQESLQEKWSIKPEQVPDFLALMGDASDNIPGVKGIGEKRASKILSKFKSVEDIYRNFDKLENKRFSNYLEKGEEEAKFSKKLTEIKTNLALDVEINDLKHNQIDKNELVKICKEMEFSSLVQEFQEDQEKIREKKDYTCIDTENELDKLVNKLSDSSLLSIDLETTSVRPMEAEIVGISISRKAHEAYYIPFNIDNKQKELFAESKELNVLQKLKPILENSEIKKCGQNLKYDLLILERYGIEVKGVDFDTMIAAYLLEPDKKKFSLGKLSEKYLYYEMQPIEELIGSGDDQQSMAEVPNDKITFYACEDADVAYQLTPLLKDKLDDNKLDKIYYDIEIPLINVLINMEKNGTYVDIEYLQKMSRNLKERIEELSGQVYEEAGVEFNLNSPKQLSEVLFDKLGLPDLKQGSTAKNVLKKLKDKSQIPEMVLEYRRLTKLKNTYLDAFPELVNDSTGRIHTSFNQTIASTGRLTSSSPNFQNIPIKTELGKQIRKAFKPQQENYKILSADYSQIELRVMAHLSQDEELLEAFQEEDTDIHTRTAASVYKVPEEEVDSDMRRAAKVVNYGIMYGASPYRLSNELDISIEEARDLKDRYFETYSGINDFIMRTLEKAKEDGFVKTLAGRIRYTHGINSDNSNVQNSAERTAINLPIQGTAADMIKIAMININKRLKSENWKSMMILQIHDELLFEIPEREVDPMIEMVREEMETALSLEVPLDVDIGVGASWYEAH